MEEIKSKENKLVKLIRSLATKKAREEHHLFLLEGPKVIMEAFGTDATIKALCIREDLLEVVGGQDPNGKGTWLMELVRVAESKNQEHENAIRIVAVEKEIFRGLTETENSQGVLAVLEMKTEAQRKEQWDGIIEGPYTLLALDEIKDPGNMGTIIRTAEAFGIDGILIGRGSVDVYNEKVIRSTMGSILRMPIFHADPLERCLAGLKEQGADVIGADPHSEKDFRGMEHGKKVVIVIGNEANGISAPVRETLTDMATIPMSGRAESLNAAIAASLMAYEFARKK